MARQDACSIRLSNKGILCSDLPEIMSSAMHNQNTRYGEEQQWKFAIMLFSEDLKLQSLLVFYCFNVCGYLLTKRNKKKERKGKRVKSN